VYAELRVGTTRARDPARVPDPLQQRIEKRVSAERSGFTRMSCPQRVGEDECLDGKGFEEMR